VGRFAEKRLVMKQNYGWVAGGERQRGLRDLNHLIFCVKFRALGKFSPQAVYMKEYHPVHAYQQREDSPYQGT
jgi:hypothetical protein